jgi:hypothetical protein
LTGLNTRFGVDTFDETKWTHIWAKVTPTIEYNLFYGGVTNFDALQFPTTDIRQLYQDLLHPDDRGHILHDALLVSQLDIPPTECITLTAGRFVGTQLCGGAFLLNGFYNFEISRGGVGTGRFVTMAYWDIYPIIPNAVGLIPFVCGLQDPYLGCGFVQGVGNTNAVPFVDPDGNVAQHLRARSTLNFGAPGFNCTPMF